MLDDSEKSRLADAWITLQKAEMHSELYKSHFWAFDKVLDLAETSPLECWDVVMKIFMKEPDDELLAIMAACPVEDLLGAHGEQIIGLVEEAAQKYPRFREMLSGVWQVSISDQIWQRLQIAIVTRKS